MEISARNILKGRVTRVQMGAVNAEVEIELAGGIKVVSIITKTSAGRLNLDQGKEVFAAIKASDV
jgi:molybdopterin-binding protein